MAQIINDNSVKYHNQSLSDSTKTPSPDQLKRTSAVPVPKTLGIVNEDDEDIENNQLNSNLAENSHIQDQAKLNGGSANYQNNSQGKIINPQDMSSLVQQ